MCEKRQNSFKTKKINKNIKTIAQSLKLLFSSPILYSQNRPIKTRSSGTKFSSAAKKQVIAKIAK